jgi:hypothetical protein
MLKRRNNHHFKKKYSSFFFFASVLPIHIALMVAARVIEYTKKV